MLRRKKSAADRLLLALFVVVAALAVVLAMVGGSRMSGVPYLRSGRQKGAVQWGADVASRTGLKLSVFMTQAPSLVEIEPGKEPGAAESSPGRIYKAKPLAKVAVVPADERRPSLPVLSKDVAFGLIRSIKKHISASLYNSEKPAAE